MTARAAAARLWMAEAHELPPVRIKRGSTIRDVARAAIADGLNQLTRFAPGACRGNDPEDVHKARVATRRMRSQLKSIPAGFDPGWLDTTRSELRWLGASLGAVRDADVMIQRIQQAALELPTDDRAGAAIFVERLEARRTDARKELVADLEGDRCRSLVDQLRAAATHGPAGPHGSEAAARVAPALFDRAWRQLERSVSALPPEPSDIDLHGVRIRAKRFRYTAEILVPVLSGDAGRLVRAVSRLQGALGDIHDSHCAQTWLRNAPESVPQALVAGILVASEARKHTDLVESWRSLWVDVQKVNAAVKPK